MARTPSEASGTVARVVRMLKCLAESEETSIKQLSEQLELPPSTVHRLLQLLAEQGLVARGAGGSGYRSGAEFFRIASLIVSRTSVGDIVEPFLRSVVETCNEACFYNVYLPATRRVMTLRAVNSTHPLRYELTLNVPSSLLWGATGKSVLAFLPQAEIDAAHAEATPSPAHGKRPASRRAFLAELEEIRQRGYACTHGQKVPGAVGIGAPVFDAQGAVQGSLCLTIPEQRFDSAAEASLARLLMRHARELGVALGGGGPAERSGARR